MNVRALIKGLAERYDVEYLRGLFLLLKLKRCSKSVFKAKAGELPLYKGSRRIILGNRQASVSVNSPNRSQLNKVLDILNQFNAGRDTKICEIGCHKGLLLDALSERGFKDVKGVDYGAYTNISKEHILSKKGVPIDNRGFEVADYNGSDFIFSFDVFEHIKSWRLFLDKIIESLSPGGVAYVNYNPYFGINGGHSAATIDIPWGHVFLEEDEMIRCFKNESSDWEERSLFYKEFLNRVSIPDVIRYLNHKNCDVEIYPYQSLGDRYIYNQIYSDLVVDFEYTNQLFVRKVEIFIRKSNFSG